MESAFVSRFCNWKDGTHCSSKHEVTSAHEAAVDVSINTPHTSRNVGDKLSSENLKLALPDQSGSKYQGFFIKARYCYAR